MPPMYNLPDGRTTYDKKAYLDAWVALGKAVEARTGYRPRGFDPTLSFADPEGEGSVQIPAAFALAIAKLPLPDGQAR